MFSLRTLFGHIGISGVLVWPQMASVTHEKAFGLVTDLQDTKRMSRYATYLLNCCEPDSKRHLG